MSEEEAEKKEDLQTIDQIELSSLKEEVEKLRDYKDKYLRLLAEQENARKRLQKERQELVQYSLQNLILEMLHPIDHFERALMFSEQMSEEIQHWGQGFMMILTQFKEALNNQGVSPIHSKPGDEFDPHIHEAVEMVETDDHPPGKIVQETMKGYKMGDRVIRPARVSVSKEKVKEENNMES